MGKSGPNAIFNLIFLGLGWPWVVEFVGFIIIFICFPTQQNLVNRKHRTNCSCSSNCNCDCICNCICIWAVCDLPNWLGLGTIWILLWNRRTPQPKANRTQEKSGQKWHLGHFFPQHFFFCAIFFSVGWDWFYIGNRPQKTQPNQILQHRARTALYLQLWL